MINEPRAKTDARLNEAIKRYPALTPYLPALDFIFFEFYAQGGRVIFLDHKKSSMIHPELQLGKRVVNLHLGVLNRTDHLTVIWSAFHEWGHLQQTAQTEEIRLNPILTYNREKEAWAIGEIKLKEFANLNPFLSHFATYQEICLKDYFDKIV